MLGLSSSYWHIEHLGRACRYERWWCIEEDDGGMLPEWHRELTADFTVWLQPVLSPQKKDHTAHTCAVGGSPAYRLSNTFSCQVFCRWMFRVLRHMWVIPGTIHLVGKWFSGPEGILAEFSLKLIWMNCVLSYLIAPYSQLFPSGELSATVLTISSAWVCCLVSPQASLTSW